MLWAIFYIAVLLWLVGIIVWGPAGGFLHLLLVVAAVALIWDLITRNKQRPA